MRLQNTTSCTEKYYAISEQNIFSDLLCLFLLCVSVCVWTSVCVCLLHSQIDPPKCVNPPKCAVQIPPGGKRLLECDFMESNGSEDEVACGEMVAVVRLQKVEHDTAGRTRYDLSCCPPVLVLASPFSSGCILATSLHFLQPHAKWQLVGWLHLFVTLQMRFFCGYKLWIFRHLYRTLRWWHQLSHKKVEISFSPTLIVQLLWWYTQTFTFSRVLKNQAGVCLSQLQWKTTVLLVYLSQSWTVQTEVLFSALYTF